MPARLLVDSTNPADLPRWAEIQAFYIDGRYAATAQQIASWHGPKVLINVTGIPEHGGDMLDVETGDATPAAIPAWYDFQLAKGTRNLGVYSNRDNFAECTNALGTRRAARWLATLAGPILHTFDGLPIDACQAFGESITGGHYDLSVVFNDAWHAGGDVDLSSADAAHLAHLVTVAQTDLASVQRFIKTL